MTPLNDSSLVDILLVEDNPDDIELTLRALSRHNLANRIQVIEDGETALAVLRQRVERVEPMPRVVLLDLKLPKVSGLEVLRQLKESETTRGVPVVVLASSREDSDLREAYRLGVNSYIVKPVEFVKFARAVSELGYYWVLLNELPT
ncbi:MAG: response regulator [Puniceicoccaceae bacterium]|nr:MAG: response regulator [Puniceicoccaceae bacterium]